jgi:hypothetical protein
VVRLLLVALALGGCFEDRYQCTTDAQCDLGGGGRCEANGYCTAFDDTCRTERRFSAHAGALSGTCYDDATALANPCAGGQGPARAEGCYADVCARLPACCDLAWTDACVQIAQEACELSCDTRIAITATRQTTTELWDARWDGSSWTVKQRTELGSPMAWVAPELGTTEPRLAAMTAGGLTIGNAMIPVVAGRTYEAVTSIGFDRDERLSVAASYSTLSMSYGVELRTLTDTSLRDMVGPAAENMSWGDLDRDGFPDAVVRTGNAYSLLQNLADDTNGRKLSAQSVANTTGGQTLGSQQLRAIDWLDIDGDTRLDLVVFGNSVRIHKTAEGIRDAAELELDCLPPSTARSCQSDPEPNLESASYVGAALPTSAEPGILMAPFPGRKLYRARVQGDAVIVTTLKFPGDTCSCIENCNMNLCPGASCTCNYDCSACVPILAVASRDLDHDRRLDLVAIDAKLQLYTALASGNFAWSAPVVIPSPFGMNFQNVTLSVTGAPTP